MTKDIKIEPGRTAVKDGEIPETIFGTRGPYYLWINPVTSVNLLFIWIYGFGDESHLAWGEIMLYRQLDIDYVTNADADTMLAFVITQPDAAKSNARPGGLRPTGRLTNR